MIRANTLANLISYTPLGLTSALHRSGHTESLIETAEFLGMTHGVQWCYKVTFIDEHTGQEKTGKVFLTYHPSTNSVSANL